jgi:hypothetical protein
MSGVQRYQSTQALYQQGQSVKAEADRRVLLGWGFFSGGVLVLLLTFAIRNSDNNFSKGFGLLFAGALGGAAATVSHRDEITTKLGAQFDQAARQRLAGQLNRDHNFGEWVGDVRDTQDKLSLIAMLPPEQQYYWLDRLGLLGMVPQAEIIPAQLQTFTVGKAANTMAIAPGEFDTSWLNRAFAYSSKVVVSERGGGKSNYLRWEVAQIAGDELILIDPHLLANQAECGGAAWLDCSAEEEREKIPHTAPQIKRILNTVLQEGRDRLQGQGKIPGTIKIVFDEGDAETVTGRDGCIGELLEFLNIAANEFRKVKIEITIVLHTLKKGRTGIDAAILSQFSWLIMGGFGASPDVVWPSDFDAKHWSQQREAANSQLPQSKARAAILRTRGDGQSAIAVVTMPRIESVTVKSADRDTSTETQSETVLDKLRSRLGDRATVDQIVVTLTQIMGEVPTEAAILYAIQESGIEVIGED